MFGVNRLRGCSVYGHVCLFDVRYIAKLDEQTRAKYDLSSLRVAVQAAAPCPIDVKYAMIDWWGPILHEYYSSTEANGVTLIDSEQWQRKPGSVGKAALGVIHICADEGTEFASGRDRHRLL